MALYTHTHTHTHTHTRVNLKDKKSGITLISLIVTIIILLILAGVTLSLIGGSEGILGRSTHAVDENERAMAKEQVELALSDYQAEFFEGKYVERTNDGTKKEYILGKLQGETYTEKYRVVTSEEGIVKVYEKNGVSKNPVVTGKVQEDGSIKWDDEVEMGTPEPGQTEEKNEDIKISVAQPNVSDDYVKSTVQIQVEYTGMITEITINDEKIEATKGENGIYQIQKEFTENGEYKIIAKDETGKIQIGTIPITELTEDMEIWNKADMELLRDKVNSGRTFEGRTASVMADIDLEGSETNQWIPIANYVSNAKLQFKGTLEGSKHKISNIYINSSSNYQGLLGCNSGIVQNLNLENGYVKGVDYIGGICGYNAGTIRFCSNYANVLGKIVGSYAANPSKVIFPKVGGVIGRNKGKIENCYNHGSVTTDVGTNTNGNSYVGGVCGINEYGTIEGCYNAGTITGKSTRDTVVGGVCADNSKNSLIKNSYNIGSVTCSTHKGTGTCGGIVGIGRSGSKIECTYNTGKISNTTYKGAIIGENPGGTVKTSYYLNTCGAAGLGTSTVATTFNTLSNSLGTQIWQNDEKDETGSWKYNNGYPILKWQLEN